MSLLTIKEFKGLRQDLDYPELPREYCHELENIDVDEAVGALKMRGGFSIYHLNALSFTNLLSGYEYRFNKGSSTRFIVNDGGTLKVSSDAGASWSNLTLPTGSTLEAGFRNQYFGWKDHVIITAGNGSTDHILWYGYVDRDTTADTGLFGNVKGSTGYILSKSQLIAPHGTFSQVYNVVFLDDFYYITFIGSKWIEKRDSSFRLVDRFDVQTEEATQTISVANGSVCLCSDGTYIYTCGMYATGDIIVEKVNPVGWTQEAEYTDAQTTSDTAGICCDSTHLYVLTAGTNGLVYKILTSNMSLVDGPDAFADYIDICCDDTANTGQFYVIDTGAIYKNNKSNLGTASDTDATPADAQHCAFDNNGDLVYVSDLTGDGFIYEYDGTNIAGGATSRTNIDEPKAFVPEDVSGVVTWRGISSKYGTVEDINGSDTHYPGLVGINVDSLPTSGVLEAGTFFYKVSLVDVDGQEFTLSDPVSVIVDTATTYNVLLRLICHTDYLSDLYRVQYINIYRGYTSDTDAEAPGTDYKFLKQVDINSSKWVDDETNEEVFYYDYTDNTAESSIASTTFLESSGIGDTVKPRPLNGKYLTWFEDRLYVANYSHDGETYPYGYVRSPLNQPDNITIYDPFGYREGGGEAIVDLGDSFARLVVFKTRSFATYRDGVMENWYPYGLSSEGGFTKVNEEILFVSNKGIHLYTGTAVTTVGDAVKTYFEAASSLDNVSVYYVEQKDRVYFSIRNDLVLVYNTKHGVWTKYDSNFAFRDFFKTYANEYVAWQQTGIYKILDGSTKDYENSILEQAITATYESPLLRFSRHEGELVTLIGARNRYEKNSDDVCNFKLYEYNGSKTLKQTIALNDPTGTSRDFINALLGENFTVRIEILSPSTLTNSAIFEHHGYSIEFSGGGYEL